MPDLQIVQGSLRFVDRVTLPDMGGSSSEGVFSTVWFFVGFIRFETGFCLVSNPGQTGKK
jgi:hypothetical protein